MKAALLCVAGVLSAGCIGARQMRGDFEFSDAASLAAKLRELQHSLNEQNAEGVRSGLPSAWHVRTPDGEYSVSTGALRGLLERLPSKDTRKAAVADAQAWLDSMATQLEAYAGAAAPGPNARASLQRILARPEFAGNGPPSAWDRFRERIAARIDNWLKHLLHIAREHPTGGQVVFWLAIVGATGLLGLWLVGLWRRDSYELAVPGCPHSIPARTWEQWLSAARAAANEGDLRRAIQCAYWSGISRLQDSGALPRDLTHTPREYLRLVTARQEGEAVSPAIVNSLGGLTSHLERFWYARATATTDDFLTCLGSLEALDCKAD